MIVKGKTKEKSVVRLTYSLIMSSDSMGISTFGEETQESSNYINFRD
jgi:hypothetical protein